MPPGIVALAADSAGGSLVISGEEAAINQVKSLIRILDVPPTRVAVSLYLLRVDAAALAGLPPLDQPPNGEAPRVRVGSLGPQPLATLLQRAAVVDHLELTTGNNRPVRLFWRPSPAWQPVSVTPRVNGDGSITTLVPFRLTGTAEGKPVSEDVTALRRLSGSQALVAVSEVPGLAIVIRMSVQPARAAPPAG
jgi:hypothetical protein